MMKNNIKTYDELSKLKTFKERFEYLKLDGKVCEETFGYDRYLNQTFYKTPEWKKIRDYVITRDNGCDLGLEGYDIYDENILVHHMNPITEYDIINRTEFLLDPKYLISTVDNTHRAIHYGNDMMLKEDHIVRTPNDTCPWKKN